MAQREHRAIPHKSGSFSILAGRLPIGGRDYPRDEAELEAALGTERSCLAFIERGLYPSGFSCQACHSQRDPWRSGTGLIACRACQQPVKLTAGSLFEDSGVPLRHWFRLFWEVANSENGASADAIRRWLEIGDPALAATYLQEIRGAMAAASSDKLGGRVTVAVNRIEVDSSQGMLRSPVLLAMKVSARHTVRLRLRHLPQVSSVEVVRFVNDTVERGARVETVPWRGFAGLSAEGFVHRVQPIVPATTHRRGVPDAQQLWSVLRLWLWSTPAVDADTLQGSLDEFAFRYGRRDYPAGLLFYRLCTLVIQARARDHRLLRAEGAG